MRLSQAAPSPLKGGLNIIQQVDSCCTALPLKYGAAAAFVPVHAPDLNLHMLSASSV
jgi:hypothetical protein